MKMRKDNEEERIEEKKMEKQAREEDESRYIEERRIRAEAKISKSLEEMKMYQRAYNENIGNGKQI